MEFEGTSVGLVRILIVEAASALRESITELVRTLGHETTVSDSGRVLVLLEPDKFDLMLVSCSVTNFDGSRGANPSSET